MNILDEIRVGKITRVTRLGLKISIIFTERGNIDNILFLLLVKILTKITIILYNVLLY